MTNFEMLSSAIKLAGVYLTVALLVETLPVISLFVANPETVTAATGISYAAPKVLLLLFLFLMVFKPTRLARWASPSQSDSTEAIDPPLDLALIGIRLLGLWFIVYATPGLADIPRTFGTVTSGAYSLADYFMQYAFSTIFYLLAGFWLFFGGERLARYIRATRTANFERSNVD